MKNCELTLTELLGNDDVKQTLSAWMKNDRFPHALLIEGAHGSGRRTLANLLARAMVCRDERHRPCGVCTACVKAVSGHPDILRPVEERKTQSIGVDSIRALRRDAYVKPNEADVRVMLLFDVEQMTVEAQNALLKILEEPPAHLRFILTCGSRTQLLPTICSRVTAVTLRGVEEQQAVAFLKKAFPDSTPEDIGRAVRASGGVLGRAKENLADEAFRKTADLTVRMAEALAAPQEMALLSLTGELEKDKTSIGEVLTGLRALLRDALCVTAGRSAQLLSLSPEAAERMASQLTAAQLMRLLETIDELEAMQTRNMNTALFLTVLCERFRTAAGR